MLRRASRVRGALVTVTLVLATAGCGSGDRAAVARAAGPDLTDVATLADLKTAIRAYDGPYTIRIANHRAGEVDVVHFDGSNVSLRFAEGYENRATSDGWCYQGAGSRWASERTVEDVDFTFHRYQGLSVGYGDQWTEAFQLQDHDDRSIVLVSNGSPPPESVDRLVLRVDHGRPTELVTFVGHERYATERYSWEADPPVHAPRRAEPGIDVTC